MDNHEIVQPKELSVEEVFKDTEYIIPIYQRNYAWEEKEIKQLLGDINDVQLPDDINDAKGKNKYYLGSLIVNEVEENRFEVIDGQQRLTTLYLLLSLLDDESVLHHQVLRFEAREKSNRTLKEIDKKVESQEPVPKANWYSTEIIEGYSVICEYFNDLDSKIKNFKRDFKEKLKSVIIFRIQVPKDIDLNHYFEIMNTRGEQLELHEIAKAKIIGAINSADPETDKEDKMIAATIWDACAQMDTYVQMNFPIDKRKALFGENWDTFQCDGFGKFRDIFKVEKSKEAGTTDGIIPVDGEFSLEDILSNPDRNGVGEEKTEDEENKRFESIISFSNFVLQVNKAMNASDNTSDDISDNASDDISDNASDNTSDDISDNASDNTSDDISDNASDNTSDDTSDNENDTSFDDKSFIKHLKKHWTNCNNAKDFIYNLLKYRYLFDRYIIKRKYTGEGFVKLSV